MSKVQDMVASIDGLASLPAVYQQVRNVLDNPQSSILDLTNVVSADVGITVRLLQVVNSVYFGLMSRVDTASRAVQVLGMQQVHDIVLATSMSSLFKGISPENMNMTRFWSNSVMRALVARTGAEMVRTGDLERFFVEGLLADLGHLVMYMAEPGPAEKAQVLSEQTGKPLHELEWRLLGCDYAQVGAALIEQWGLPPRLATAIRGQIAPVEIDEPFRRNAAFLHLARIMTDGMEQKLDSDAIAAKVDASIWQLTGLLPPNLATIRLIVEMNHSEVLGLYFPQLKG